MESNIVNRDQDLLREEVKDPLQSQRRSTISGSAWSINSVSNILEKLETSLAQSKTVEAE